MDGIAKLPQMLHTGDHLFLTTQKSSSTLNATTAQQAHRLAERAMTSKHITSNLLNQDWTALNHLIAICLKLRTQCIFDRVACL